jgi:hypothetical protein
LKSWAIRQLFLGDPITASPLLPLALAGADAVSLSDLADTLADEVSTTSSVAACEWARVITPPSGFFREAMNVNTFLQGHRCSPVVDGAWFPQLFSVYLYKLEAIRRMKHRGDVAQLFGDRCEEFLIFNDSCFHQATPRLNLGCEKILSNHQRFRNANP